MSDHANIRFLEPLEPARKRRGGLLRCNPTMIAFGVVVVLPTLIAAIYFLLIASPRYISESHFIVRRAGDAAPAALGLALSGVGLSPTATDAFMVHEYIRSRSSVDDLSKANDLQNVFSPKTSDPLSRAVKPWSNGSKESLFKSIQKFFTVGYDSTTGISTIRVEAFTPEHAQSLNNQLLDRGENLINTMNQRSSAQAVAEAEKTVSEATARLQAAQNALTDFRNRQQFVDPESTASGHSEIIGRLMGEVASLEAQKRQIQAETPDNPLLPSINRRLDAYREQMEIERRKVAGDSNSLAPKLGTYEALIFERDLASRTLTAANTAFETARIDSRRQHLFLDRVVAPNLPDKAMAPKRLLSVLTVLASCLLLFSCGYLIWAGMREHRHG